MPLTAVASPWEHCRHSPAAAAELQDACGVPLGLVVQPLARPNGAPPPAPACWAGDLARCARCQGYINALCDVDGTGWACSLCGCANDFSTATSLRRYYGAAAERRAALAELAAPAVDVLCPLVAADPEEGTEDVLALEAQPAVLALVDVCSGEEGMELVKSSLAAAVEALPPAARFGLVSFGSQVGLHPVAGGNGGVLHIPLAGREGARASLQDAAPLGRMLAQVGSCKQSILAAVEALEVEPPVGGGKERALGDALRAVLRWVAVGAPQAAAEGLLLQQRQQQQQQQQQEAAAAAAGAAQEEGVEGRADEEDPGYGGGGGGGDSVQAAQGFPGMRLLLFLSGPPNCGAGAVVARKPSAAEVAAAVEEAEKAAQQAAQELAALVLDPQYPELSAWTDAVSRSTQQQRQSAAEAAARAAAAAGDLSHAAPPGVAAEQLEVNLGARDFYAEAGAAAAALGISVDIFAACPRWMGLDLLDPLTSTSGGTMLLYRSLEAAAMPQDVYKSVAQPRAFSCMLRLRCSPELELRGAHGRLVADSKQPDLFRLVACTPDDAFAFDLDRSTQQLACTAPAIQLVLQYSVLLPAATHGGAGSDGSRFVLHRRMRVITAALPLAETPDEMFGSCDAEALTCIAVHKALATAAEQGVREARQMLFDWLALLTSAVAECQGGGKKQPDAALAEVQSLHHLPHMVYALLHGPLLQPPGAAPPQRPAPWRHPDAPAAMRALLRVLCPDDLSVAVCPQLTSWSNPDTVAVPQHSLSSAALAVGQQPIWVLDSYYQLVVLYTQAAAAAAAPFPPPADSALRRMLGGIRAARRSTPELLMMQEGRHEVQPFADWLLEDADAAATAAAPGGAGQEAQQAEHGEQQAQQQQAQQEWPTFVAFLEAVTREARRLLSS